MRGPDLITQYAFKFCFVDKDLKESKYIKKCYLLIKFFQIFVETY